jgi:hypothetical protein
MMPSNANDCEVVHTESINRDYGTGLGASLPPRLFLREKSDHSAASGSVGPYACSGCFRLERIASALHPPEKRRVVTAHPSLGHSGKARLGMETA